jgi:hypothetical protein
MKGIVLVLVASLALGSCASAPPPPGATAPLEYRLPVGTAPEQTFDKVALWASMYFQSSKNVVTMSDKASGLLSGRGQVVTNRMGLSYAEVAFTMTVMVVPGELVMTLVPIEILTTVADPTIPPQRVPMNPAMYKRFVVEADKLAASLKANI